MDFEIRKMRRHDLDTVIEWAASEGWNPGIHDRDAFFDTDPDGFFMAWDGKKPAGSISAVSYGKDFGFIGFFIVRPEYRGHRLGLELGKVACSYLAGRNIGIDGVEKKVHNYETHGFTLAWNNARYEGLSRKSVFPAGIIPLCDLPFKEILNFDSRFFPAPREKFLKKWLVMPESFAFASPGTASEINAYGLARKCRTGYKIGPLFAESVEIAEKILSALCSSLPTGTRFYLDIPAVNENAVKLALNNNMKAVFRTARMYLRKLPDIPLKNVFGITSYELG
ncbi:MAG: hypothetical protein A2020_02535 [Lentisphaerae bacterium GWF2_45_14]|nr:MAG: hypothetical protein A2020_02535 [Lentisphaerae bacterium GWF2_45_14]